MLLLSQE